MPERRTITDVEASRRDDTGRLILKLKFGDLWEEVAVRDHWLGSRIVLESKLNATFDDIEVEPERAPENGYAVLLFILREQRLLTVTTGMDVGQLLNTQFAEPKFLVPGLIPEGLTVLAGPPKVGKSWWLYDLAIQSAAGGVVLGGRVDEHRDVLYLALEDSLRRMRSRLVTLQPDGLPPGVEGHLEIQTRWPPFSDGGLSMLQEWVRRHRGRYSLILVDTLQKMRQGEVRSRSLNAYEADVDALSDLQAFAVSEAGLSVVTNHHVKKAQEDDFLAMLSGSFGIGGTADTVMVLKRARNSEKGSLELTGRDVEETALAVRFDGTRWHREGDLEEYQADSTKGRIQRELGERGPLTVSDLADLLELKTGTVKRSLYRLKDEELVIQMPGAKWAVPEELESGVNMSPKGDTWETSEETQGDT